MISGMTRRGAAGLLIGWPMLCERGLRASGEETNRAWQTGRLLDARQSGYFKNEIAKAAGKGRIFVIEFEAQLYLVRERLRHGAQRPNLKTEGPIRFAVEKRKLFVVDEDNAAHEMELLKQAAREKGAH
jgi:hypothetical protein